VSQVVARYQQNDVFSMSPARRVVFLYGQALASLRQGARYLEAGEPEPRTRALHRAREIFAELLGTLDFEVGGQLARSLAALYAWFIDETLEAERRPDVARLTRVIGLVAELHGAWQQAETSVRDQEVGAGQ
jgi:flagellar secretion chaperone FliS